MDIRNKSFDQSVTMEDVVMQHMNDSDNIWFYESLKRIGQLEGRERFQLEDMIKKKLSGPYFSDSRLRAKILRFRVG